MTEPLGDEFIRIHADASAFRAEVEAQVGAAMAAVRTQVAATPIAAPTVAAARATTTKSGLVVVSRDAEALVAAQQKAGRATATTTEEVRRQGTAAARTAPAMRSLQRTVGDQERSLGRATRGLVAANAAATGVFRAVTFASGAFLAGAVAGGVLASAMQELSESTRLAAQTTALIEATGGAANVTAAQVDQLSESLLNLTGVDDELIKSSANVLLTFKNIQNQGEGVNAVFDRAVKSTLDISSVMGTNLRSTAIQVGKALQDPIRGVTALRRSGISLSQSQRDMIKQFVETGQILRAQRLILREIEGQIGGTAEAVGQTMVGQLNRLKGQAANTLADYLQRITQSAEATELAAHASQTLQAAWRGLRRIVEELGPPVVDVARGLGRAAEALGGPGVILGAAVAYKALGASVSGATTLLTIYRTASAGAAAATLAQAAAAGTATAALEAQAAAEVSAAAAARRSLAVMGALSAVFAAGAAFSGQWEIAIVAAGASVAAFTARVVALRAAMIAATGAAAASQVALAALGGPIGIAALGVTALVGGAILLKRHMDNAAGSVNAFSRSLDEMSAAVKANRTGRDQLAAAMETLSEKTLDVRDANLALDLAQKRASESAAERGSVEQRALAEDVRQAQERLTEALNSRHAAQSRVASEQFRQQQREEAMAGVVQRTTQRFLEQVDALRKVQSAATAGLEFGGEGEAAALAAVRAEAAADALATFRERMEGLAQSADPLERRVAPILLGIAAAIGDLPTDRQVRITFRLAGEGANARVIFDALNIAERNRAEELRFRNELQRFDRQQLTSVQEQRDALEGRLTTIKEIVQARREEHQTALAEAQAAKERLNTAEETLRTARLALTEARRALTETIRASSEAITDAVTAAKQNLRTLADAVAEALGRMSEESEAVISPELARRFRELREQARLGLGGPETRRAAQQIEALAAAQRGDIGDTDRIKRQLADLSNALNFGRLTLPQFNQRLSRILRGAEFDPREFRRRFGPAAADEITQLIADLRAQAGLIVRGPQRPGGGIATDLVDPLEAVAQANQDIADAQRAVRERIRDVNIAIRDRNRAQAEYERLDKIEQTKHTRLLQVVARRMGVQNQLLRLQTPPRGNRPKPTGSGARESQIVTEPYPR